MEASCKNLYWFCLPAASAALLAGCTDPGPLDDDQPRTQYIHYHELRGEDPPLTIEDALGNTRPNLRARWLEKQ